MLSPRNIILLLSLRDHDAADAFGATALLHDGARFRQARVVRSDYGMYDRRENPQYPEVERP